MKPALIFTLSLLFASAAAPHLPAQETPPQSEESPVATEKKLTPEQLAVIEELKALALDLRENEATMEKLDRLGDLYVTVGDIERGVLSYEKAIIDFGGSEKLFLKFARLMAYAGSSENALKVLDLGLEKFPESETLSYEIGKAYLGLNKLYAAVANLKKVIEKSPNNPVYRYHLADAYRRQKKWEEAGELVDALIAEDEQFLEAKLLKGDLMIGQGEGRQGLEYYESLHNDYPESKRIRTALVKAYQVIAYEDMQGGRIGSAVRNMRNALKTNPADMQTKIALGSLLVQYGEFAEAEGIFQEILEENPNHLDAYVQYGLMLEQLDRAPEAGTLYQKGLAKARALKMEDAINAFRELLGVAKK